jgi:protocatechuate 3,4-dioxygenase beta subunit
MMEREGLDRRRLLRSAGAAGLAAAFGPRALAALGEDARAATVCILTPEVTDGPYWIEQTMTRRDVTEGKPGLPLELRLTVVNARTCEPIPAADVEIWHADAEGEYSGYDGATPGNGGGRGVPGRHQTPSTSTRYLRGHQRANVAGRAEFLTVFPGWYPGRTPHIHLKVHVGGKVVHTGQVFFGEKIATKVYSAAPYRSRGPADTPHSADRIFRQAGGSRAELKLRARPGGGLVGTIVLGVATA